MAYLPSSAVLSIEANGAEPPPPAKESSGNAILLIAAGTAAAVGLVLYLGGRKDG